MRIPEIRAELGRIASSGAVSAAVARQLNKLAGELVRRKGTPRAPAKSEPMTPELRRRVRAYKRRHPDASHTEIGRKYNVNPGRVSEALIGRRH